MLTPAANPILTIPLAEKNVVELPATSASAADRTAELTRRIVAGDEAAFHEFHERYFDRLHHFLLVVTRGQEHEAQEALQQTLLRVVRYAREFESEDAFWSWLKMVARSVARDGGRKQRRYFALLENFSLRLSLQSEPQTNGEENRLLSFLEEILETLDAADRELIRGKYINGETVKELSTRTGLTEKAVESRLLRLRRQLREQLLKKLQST